MRITQDALKTIFAAAKSADPQEACGILLGQGDHIKTALSTPNVHPNPHTHFEIEPQALVDAHRLERQGGPQVIGYFHSHPKGPAVPSQTDQAMAARDNRIWAIINACAQVRFWRDGPGGFAELSYEVASG